jgi:hypothetical protein
MDNDNDNDKRYKDKDKDKRYKDKDEGMGNDNDNAKTTTLIGTIMIQKKGGETFRDWNQKKSNIKESKASATISKPFQ